MIRARMVVAVLAARNFAPTGDSMFRLGLSLGAHIARALVRERHAG